MPCRRRGTPTPGRTLDVAGAAIAVVTLASATWALTTAGERGWSDGSVIATGALAVVGAVVFVRRMVTAPDPLVPPSLFRSREFTVTNLATVLLYAGLGVSFFLVAYGLQVGAGWSATRAGVALLPATVLMLVFSSRSAALAERIGPRLQLTVGPLLAAAGLLLLMRIGPDASWVRHVLPGAIVFGLGLVTFVAPLTATVMGSVDPDQVSTASGVNNAIARTASLGAIAVIPAASGLTTASGPRGGHRRRADRARHRGGARRRRRAAVLRRAGTTRGVAPLGPPDALRGGRTAAATRSGALPAAR